MINATDLRNGTMFLYYDHPYKVLNYEHIKMSRGGATVKVKCVDLLSGAIKEISFSSNEKVAEADVVNINMQYLYKDDEFLYFMNEEDYSQIEIALSKCEYESKFLVEGKTFQITLFNGKPISVVLPPSMFYTVKEAYPAVKGNTSSGASKKVILENDLEVEVPQFIKEGDVVKINTTSCTYTGRGQSN